MHQSSNPKTVVVRINEDILLKAKKWGLKQLPPLKKDKSVIEQAVVEGIKSKRE